MPELLLIGAGKFGKNYISTLLDIPNVKLKIANRENWQKLIDQKPNGVMVCTPPDSHIEIAKFALESNIPTMIEKPLALRLRECKELQPFTAPILVNYIHLFSPEYQFIKNNMPPEVISKITSYGFGSGPIRQYSSLWDYGCHDLSMIFDLLKDYGQPLSRSIKTINTDNGQLFDLQINFPTAETHSLVGNGATRPVRQLHVYSNKFKLTYDKRMTDYREPLKKALQVFINAINGQDDYRLGLDLSFKITKFLEGLYGIIRN